MNRRRDQVKCSIRRPQYPGSNLHFIGSNFRVQQQSLLSYSDSELAFPSPKSLNKQQSNSVPDRDDTLSLSQWTSPSSHEEMGLSHCQRWVWPLPVPNQLLLPLVSLHSPWAEMWHMVQGDGSFLQIHQLAIGLMLVTGFANKMDMLGGPYDVSVRMTCGVLLKVDSWALCCTF